MNLDTVSGIHRKPITGMGQGTGTGTHPALHRSQGRSWPNAKGVVHAPTLALAAALRPMQPVLQAGWHPVMGAVGRGVLVAVEGGEG